MPRLSLYREERGADYRFFDRLVSEQMTVGSTAIFIHKYLGTPTSTTDSDDLTQPNYQTQSELNIQDLLLLENRDRVYEDDVYELRGHYTVQDMDMSNEQFGLFISNENLNFVFHLNDMVERMGRKLMPGDVLELPHLTDFWALDDSVPVALKRYYVVEDASRAGEGYSPTWYPHLWRVRVKPMVDSQEYSQILDKIVDGTGNESLRDLLSVYNQELANNQAVVEQAEEEVPASGYDTSHLYVIPSTGETPFEYADPESDTPVANGWTDGYLTGDGLAPNGHNVTSGTTFPSSPSEGDYALRLDYLPNRLFRYNGTRWVKVENTERTSLTHGEGQTQRDTFINNTNTTFTDDNQIINERVSLHDALKLQVDSTPTSSTVIANTDPTPTRPVWSSPDAGDLGTFTEAAIYSKTFVASGTGTITYSVISGSLPGGLTLSSNGVLSGTFSQVTVNTIYQFAIRATDDNGTADRSFRITVNDYNPFGPEFSSEFN